jgi:hypothetical protein
VRRRGRRSVGRHGRRRAGSVDTHGLRCIAEQICKVGGVDLLGELMYCCVSGGLESIPSELVDACATSVCRRFAVGAIGAGIVSMLAARERQAWMRRDLLELRHLDEISLDLRDSVRPTSRPLCRSRLCNQPATASALEKSRALERASTTRTVRPRLAAHRAPRRKLL